MSLYPGFQCKYLVVNLCSSWSDIISCQVPVYHLAQEQCIRYLVSYRIHEYDPFLVEKQVFGR